MSRAPSDIAEGREIAGRYVLRRPIASGGMAVVWEADDTVLGRRVAVKILHPHLAGDPVFLERFRDEAKAAARLSHPSIVAIFDTASEDDVEAIVMELIDGMTLRRYLDELGPLSVKDAVDLATHVAEALEAAHAARLVHRDIKPGNVMLCPDRRVKVTDFGIAKALEGTDHTADGTVLGTAKYLAPEQVEGTPVDERADIYALGVVLYEALTGHAPFDEETSAATALARLRRDPPSVRASTPSVPPAIDQVVRTAMARERDRRYPSATVFIAELTAAAEQPLPVPPVDPTPPDVVVDPTVSTSVPAVDRRSEAPSAETVTDERAREGRSHRRTGLLALLVIVGALSLGVGLILATSAGRDFADRVVDAVTGGADEASSGADDRAPIADDDDPDLPEPEVPVEDADPPAPPPTLAPVVPGLEIVAVADYDPFGDGEERPDLTGFAMDDDLTTAWRSEGYDNRSFGNLKPGVGLIMRIDDEATLDTLVVTSPTQGWAAQVFVAEDPGDDLESWGQPLDGRTAIEGTAEFDLRRVRGRTVLLWVTDLGEAPPRLRMEVLELRLS